MRPCAVKPCAATGFAARRSWAVPSHPGGSPSCEMGMAFDNQTDKPGVARAQAFEEIEEA